MEDTQVAYWDDYTAGGKYDEATHSITVVFAASQGKDRIGDFLEVSGIDTSKHEVNPVAYLDHGTGCKLPIGKCVDPEGNYTVTIDEEAGTATAVIYLARDIPDFVVPEQVFELYKQGVLRAGSIGYRPLKAARIPARPADGFFKDSLHLQEVELEEVSIVGLPMNADCVAKSINGRPLDECFTKMWAGTVHKSMDGAMSATDQSAGGAFVGDDDLHKRLSDLEEKHKSLEEAHKALSERYKVMTETKDADVVTEEPTETEDVKDDEPSEECKALLHEVKDHLEESADHEDTPDDLREAHSHFAKAIEACEDGDTDGEVGTGNDVPDEGSHEELVKCLQKHLEESAEHEDTPKMLAAAHKYYAAKLCEMGSKDEPEENLSPEQEAGVIKALDKIARKLSQAERKMKYVQKGDHV